MKGIKRFVLIMAVFLLPLTFAAPISLASDTETYVSDVKVVSGNTEAEVIKILKDAGYTPILKNLAEENKGMSGKIVYAGYKTTSNPGESMEGVEDINTGSVFGDSAIMIGGIAMIMGVIVGMLSMKIRPKPQPKKDEDE